MSADIGKRPLRAARANRVFGTDEKRIRTKNSVMDKGHCGFGLILSNKRNPAVDAGRDFNRHA
ncbi:MAG: hypothetical protein A3G80_11685 [Betaproteobacteria bacterium RIFCSPLOWO2_12_FULL_62_13b]|nr:MAG: hypothetical protein A3G80_11685 [Betaproteobacteria bacterium RIFCSPLOWO2_12_FULL_62_13b]